MSPVDLFARGRLADLDAATLERLLDRTPRDDPGLATSVAAILADVRERGDEALMEMAQRFDGVRLEALEVPREAWGGALSSLDPSVKAALERAATNIRRFHEAQLPPAVTLEVEPGVRITRAWTPLARVGVYAPGGRAAYPSSVLMGVVPAKAAGVTEVVVCSPPGPAGTPPREVLAACAIAGADRLFSIGGAGAVAALAYGTDIVPRVDAIVGPGNRWVTEAKRQVAGELVIDSPAGPSEVLVLADAEADARLVALEMMAQAEHDPDASCVLVSTSGAFATAAESALAAELATAPRADICSQAFATSGAILVVEDTQEAIDFVNRYAPEHLSVMTQDALSDAAGVRTAGTMFVGAAASVAFGDYMTGANHVLPTAGRSRSFSGLSTLNYLRSYTLQEIDDAGAAGMADDVATLASAEGLPAHAAAAAARRAP
ncbi:MAG: histidinol dehydrogenase [Gemmatimonadota bacterium]|nr:histidinol dehydrogenase [Gemmatimonadota bacterium]MDH3421879.1 histidinol dehydrogenase [Gemmatimonadota bacterium]